MKPTGDDSNDWGEVQRPVELSADDLREEEIDELVRNFIMPDGSDSGLTEAAYQAKERTVRKQIASGSLRIISDPSSETRMLMGSQEWRALSKH